MVVHFRGVLVKIKLAGAPSGGISVNSSSNGLKIIAVVSSIFPLFRCAMNFSRVAAAVISLFAYGDLWSVRKKNMKNIAFKREIHNSNIIN